MSTDGILKENAVRFAKKADVGKNERPEKDVCVSRDLEQGRVCSSQLPWKQQRTASFLLKPGEEK